MAESASNGSSTNGNAAPSLNVLVQYVKDLSFENPNAPRSLQPQEKTPQIGLQINVTPKKIGEHEFEVEISLQGDAKVDENVLFAFDLTYCGIFRIQNVPQDQLPPVLMIECPRLLFPFARQIISETVRDGGFPPFNIDPIDFVALYRQKAAELQAQAQAQGQEQEQDKTAEKKPSKKKS